MKNSIQTQKTQKSDFAKTIRDQITLISNKIKNEILQRQITENNENEFCLIEYDSIKEFRSFMNYCCKDFNYVYFYNEKEPKIINNLSKGIKNKFGIIKKDLLQLIYQDYKKAYELLLNNNPYKNFYLNVYNSVNDSETFNYFAGNNKLLIISKNNSALLILNPIDSIIDSF